MKSVTTARLLNYVSHPIRINIIKILHAAPKSFSEILKYFSLESSSKLSFHLEVLNPFITRNGNGNYILTSRGLQIHSFLMSVETDEILIDILPNLGIKTVKGNFVSNLVDFIKYKSNLVVYHLGILVILGSLCSIFQILQTEEYFSFLKPFSQSLFVMLFLLPAPFYVHQIYYTRKNCRSFGYLFLGLLLYTVLYSVSLSFIEQTQYFIKALLAIPERSYSYNPLTHDFEYHEWFYFSGAFPEIVIGYGKAILLNQFSIDPRVIQAYYMPRTIFWLVVCVFLILFLRLFSSIAGWSWPPSRLPDYALFPGRLRFLETGKFWVFLVCTYILFFLLFPYSYDVTIQVEHGLFLTPSGYLIPAYIHLLPIFPSVLITTLIFLMMNRGSESPKKYKLILIILIVVGPLIFWIITFFDFIYLLNISLGSTLMSFLISKVLTGFLQLLALSGLTILNLKFTFIHRKAGIL